CASYYRTGYAMDYW
nr:immunoglobulin heavy chain junction region [Mus musculus]